MDNWTERNQKAEYIGGAVAGGCAIMFVFGMILFFIAAYAICGNGC
jgi:hypothetical protein